MSDIGLVPVQVLSFLWSIAMGAALGLLYDCFRIARIALPSPAPVVAIQDIVFGLLAAIVSFGYLLTAVDGKLRLFLLIGEAVGGALYYATVGDVVMALSHFIIHLIRGFLAFIWCIITAAGRILHGLFIRPVVALYGWVSRKMKALAKRLLKRIKRVWGRLRARALSSKYEEWAKNAKNGLKKRIDIKFILQIKA